MKPIRTILHPTDFSESAGAALEIAAMLARDQGARLVILHVVPRLPPATGPGDVAALRRAETIQHDLEAYREEMRRKLVQVKPPYPNVPVEHVLKEGEIAQVILRTAEETPCDVIVIGTQGQTRRLDVLAGSVADVVTRKATCPVVVVKAPAERSSVI